MSERLDWPQELVRRGELVQQTIIPTECPACHSTRIFIGSGNLKCWNCNRVTKLEKASTTMSDLGHQGEVAAGTELQEFMQEHGGERGATRKG